MHAYRVSHGVSHRLLHLRVPSFRLEHCFRILFTSFSWHWPKPPSEQYKIQLVQLEDDLLERLANAPDDILSDVPLIEGLEATKVRKRVKNTTNRHIIGIFVTSIYTRRDYLNMVLKNLWYRASSSWCESVLTSPGPIEYMSNDYRLQQRKLPPRWRRAS